jgi:hypothetical protein
MPRYKEHEIFLKCHSDMDATNIQSRIKSIIIALDESRDGEKHEPTVIGMLHFSSGRKHASK